MSDYGMIGSFGSDATKSLSGDTITKLKEAETRAVIKPLEDDLETWDKELKKVDEITKAFNDLSSTMRAFDLFSPDSNVFEQVSAAAGGSGAAQFDAVDPAQLDEGVVSVHVSQLAQKDVFQTNIFASPDTVIENDGDGAETDYIKITAGDGTATKFYTEGKSYETLAGEIKLVEGMSASVEQVGTDKYRLVIKSTDPGTDNALIISEHGVDLGIANDTDEDGDVDGDDNTNNAANHTLTAQNFKATVDGVAYDVSASSITVSGGLTITATKTDTGTDPSDADYTFSTLSIQKDTSNIVPALDEMVEKYNSIIDLVDGELYSADSSIYDKGTFRTIKDDLKEMFFSTYGHDDLSAFNYGFSFDKNGHLSYDSDTLGKAITEDPDKIKSLFVGVAEDKGIGTKMREYFVNLELRDGLMYSYSDSMTSRKEKLEDEKEKAQKTLDAKYDAMASQFIQYGAIISQMEASFSGLKMMIENPPK